MTTEETCTREDLECYLVQSLLFTVEDSGHAGDFLDSCEYDSGDVDEYRCANCGEYWPVKNKYDSAERASAWQAALAHLKEAA